MGWGVELLGEAYPDLIRAHDIASNISMRQIKEKFTNLYLVSITLQSQSLESYDKNKQA